MVLVAFHFSIGLLYLGIVINELYYLNVHHIREAQEAIWLAHNLLFLLEIEPPGFLGG